MSARNLTGIAPVEAGSTPAAPVAMVFISIGGHVMEISKEKLASILSAHKKWLMDASEGARADLRGANLSRSDLCEADLRGADLRGANLDYSCFPLWCGGTRFKADDRLVMQVMAHLCSLDVSPEARAALKKNITIRQKVAPGRRLRDTVMELTKEQRDTFIASCETILKENNCVNINCGNCPAAYDSNVDCNVFRLGYFKDGGESILPYLAAKLAELKANMASRRSF